jgi:hypothetical protein
VKRITARSEVETLKFTAVAVYDRGGGVSKILLSV